MENTAKMIVISTDTLPIYKRSVRKLVIVLILFIAIMFSDNDVRMVFSVADPKLLTCMGFLCLYVVYKFIQEYQQIKQDTAIIEDLAADSSRINLKNLTIPLKSGQAGSFFVKSYAQLCKCLINSDRKISSFREKALKTEYFQNNKQLSIAGSILTLLGLAGTLMGLSKSLAGLSAGDNIIDGIAYAFSTTLLAIYGQIVILSINENLTNKKTLLFYSFLDLISSSVTKK